MFKRFQKETDMNIAVLCGGLSNERDVSLSGGVGIARALREQGHKVALLDLFLGWTEPFEHIEDVFTHEDAGTSFAVGENAPDLDAVRAMRPGQGLVGPNVLDICKAADIAMDKDVSKTVLRAAGIPVAEGVVLKKGEPAADVGFPCVVKPCSGGSSVGTTIVQDPAGYDAALALAFKYEDRVLVEKFIPGRELTVGVLDGKAMPVTEIIPKSGFYDYKNKYQPGMTDEPCPAPITAEETAAIQAMAERAYKALRLEAYGRVDFIMGRDGVFYCLEANTLPGMTPTSLIPRMGKAMGMTYGQLCDRLIEASLKKYGR